MADYNNFSGYNPNDQNGGYNNYPYAQQQDYYGQPQAGYPNGSYPPPEKKSSGGKIAATVIAIILVLALLGGVVYFCLRWLRNDPTDEIYISVNGDEYRSSDDGVVIDIYSSNTFKICNAAGWGDYDVRDCTVRVLNNITRGSQYDVITGVTDDGYLLFSDTYDYTFAFASGSGISVAADGSFSLVFRYTSLCSILEVYYGSAVTLDVDYTFDMAYFFKVVVTSPDGSQTLEMPFKYAYVDETHSSVTDIVLSDTSLYF